MCLRVSLSFLLKRQKKLSQEAHDLWKEPWALSFFFHGLGSNLITTVGSHFKENSKKKVPWAVVYQNDGLWWISPHVATARENARRRAEKGVSGRTSKEGRRAVGPSEGEGLRKAAMR